MGRKILGIFLAIVLPSALLLSSCTTVPITGREQLRLVPEDTLITASRQQYSQMMAEVRTIEGTAEARMVQDVGVRIAAAVEEFLEDHGRTERLEWEFNLIDSPEMNAWAMPGGKVAIYQGLMEITNTPPKLAAVMGHEVAHVIAGHGSERLSQGLLTQMGGMALSAALSNRPDQTRALWMQAYGLGAQVGVMLPYSRLHEREADRLGLIFMALAGYDPHAALEVWTAMAQRGTGPGVPAFLSTHPTDEQRISDIRSYLPEALQYYRPR
jgi:predicted Zn-dependent protease